VCTSWTLAAASQGGRGRASGRSRRTGTVGEARAPGASSRTRKRAPRSPDQAASRAMEASLPRGRPGPRRTRAATPSGPRLGARRRESRACIRGPGGRRLLFRGRLSRVPRHRKERVPGPQGGAHRELRDPAVGRERHVQLPGAG
jgi:hypothetical protein